MHRSVHKTTLHAPQQAVNAAYWLTQTVQARIDALEALRRQHYPELNDADLRLQRVCRVTQLKLG